MSSSSGTGVAPHTELTATPPPITIDTLPKDHQELYLIFLMGNELTELLHAYVQAKGVLVNGGGNLTTTVAARLDASIREGKYKRDFHLGQLRAIANLLQTFSQGNYARRFYDGQGLNEFINGINTIVTLLPNRYNPTSNQMTERDARQMVALMERVTSLFRASKTEFDYAHTKQEIINLFGDRMLTWNLRNVDTDIGLAIAGIRPVIDDEAMRGNPYTSFTPIAARFIQAAYYLLNNDVRESMKTMNSVATRLTLIGSAVDARYQRHLAEVNGGKAPPAPSVPAPLN
jgi:hypothetical protein